MDAGKADDGVEDEIRAGALEQFDQVAAGLGLGSVRLGERAHVGRAGGHGAKREVGVRVDDLDRLTPDRAGCAKERDSLHLLRPV